MYHFFVKKKKKERAREFLGFKSINQYCLLPAQMWDYWQDSQESFVVSREFLGLSMSLGDGPGVLIE